MLIAIIISKFLMEEHGTQVNIQFRGALTGIQGVMDFTPPTRYEGDKEDARQQAEQVSRGEQRGPVYNRRGGNLAAHTAPQE